MFIVVRVNLWPPAASSSPEVYKMIIHVIIIKIV